MKVIFYTSALLFSVLSAIAYAQIEPSMPPGMTPDPLPSSTPSMTPKPMRPSIPKLYLSTAGRPPFTELMITPFRRLNVCPSEYKSGFSIRCEVANAGTVFWRVRGQLYKKEYFAPYYLSGNWRTQVGPFKGLDNLPRGARLRVACRVLTRKPVWVDLIKSC